MSNAVEKVYRRSGAVEKVLRRGREAQSEHEVLGALQKRFLAVNGGVRVPVVFTHRPARGVGLSFS